MKRIIKETFNDGSVQYRVETNKLFGLTVGWRTDKVRHVMDNGEMCSLEAIFNTLNEAKIYCGFPLKTIVKRKIINDKD